MAFSQQEVKRLAFIRFLYSQGLEQAARPQPLNAPGLLSFHDAVEMFLLLAGEHLKVNYSKGVNFEGYFTEIEKATGVVLPSRPAMRRMNSSRVNFKHHGSIPSAQDLAQFQADVTTFLTDATKLVFQADFAGIDMVDLVTQQDVAAKLREAETQAQQGGYHQALALLSEAFDGLLDDYADRKIGANGSPYRWWPLHPGAAPHVYHSIFGGGHDAQLVRRTDGLLTQAKRMDAALSKMERSMRVIAMGLDYRRYARFDTAAVDRYLGRISAGQPMIDGRQPA